MANQAAAKKSVGAGAVGAVQMGYGGISPATVGGVLVQAAERGVDEAYIPLERTPRSLSLFNAAAQKLGISSANNSSTPASSNFIFSPTVNVYGPANQTDVENAIKNERYEFEKMFEEMWEAKRRESLEH